MNGGGWWRLTRRSAQPIVHLLYQMAVERNRIGGRVVIHFYQRQAPKYIPSLNRGIND